MTILATATSFMLVISAAQADVRETRISAVATGEARADVIRADEVLYLTVDEVMTTEQVNAALGEALSSGDDGDRPEFSVRGEINYDEAGWWTLMFAHDGEPSRSRYFSIRSSETPARLDRIAEAAASIGDIANKVRTNELTDDPSEATQQAAQDAVERARSLAETISQGMGCALGPLARSTFARGGLRYGVFLGEAGYSTFSSETEIGDDDMPANVKVTVVADFEAECPA